MHAKMKLLQVIITLFISISIASLITEAAENNSTKCDRSCGSKTVPYPFGFSDGCPIRLRCNRNGGDNVKIAGFSVENVTESSVFVDLPAQCNRSVSSISSLFADNYALTWRNSLLLQSCGAPRNDCVIPIAYVTGRLNLTTCNGNNESINCFAQVNNSGVDVMSYEDLNQTGCGNLFSSFAADSAFSFQFQRLELSWWLPGPSLQNCDKNATSTNVTLPGGQLGYRCSCIEGFKGDGFVAGDGCRRAPSNCNPSKYINGECGGTTRIGVLIGGIIAGASLMAILALACYFIIRRRSTSLRNQMSAKRLLCEAAGNSSVPFYPYKEIEKATSCFSEKQRLGTGAYGTVYAGKLHNDEWVAIKRFRHRDTDSIDQVMNEIKLLSSVSHPNLVRLLGCCVEEGEPILVYEYMPNGTLSQHLQRERGNGLPWTIRVNIATETAKAVAYLHSAMNPPIYHRDIKSSNILLDYHYRSKVADFGLSRLGMTESSHISTAPQGTPGYLDPQYHQYFHLSDKSDVYSFGVVLVEIITGLKVVDFSRAHSEVNLAALAIDRIGRGCVDEIIDTYLEPHRDAWTLSSIHNVAELAFRCLAFHRDMRPTMMEVAEELEQIRLSAWIPNMYMASPAASSRSSSDIGSEKSLSCLSMKKAMAVVGSRRVIVPQRLAADCLTSLEEVKDDSPVSVQDHWLSEQSSPSTNSLLENVVQ